MRALKRYELFFLSLFICMAGMAQQPASFQKEYHFYYDTLNKEALIIHNWYGNVEVSTWNKPGIQVQVTISAKAPTTEDAQAVAARVTVADHRGRDSITCSTIIAPGKRNYNRDIKCRIDYRIFLPAGTSLKINNRFGNISLGDYTGRLTIIERAGHVKTGELSGPTGIFLGQASASITRIHNGKIAARAFDSLTIGAVQGRLMLTLSIGQAINIGLSGDSCTIIAGLYQLAAANLYYSPGLSAIVQVHTSEFSELNNRSTLILTEDPVQKKSAHGLVVSHTGRSGAGNATIKFNCAYSKLNIFNQPAH